MTERTCGTAPHPGQRAGPASQGRTRMPPDAPRPDDQQTTEKETGHEASLQKIYAILFEKKISKGQRLTNWDAEILTEPQKKYAALDAWSCLKIYNYLNPAE